MSKSHRDLPNVSTCAARMDRHLGGCRDQDEIRHLNHRALQPQTNFPNHSIERGAMIVYNPPAAIDQPCIGVADENPDICWLERL